MNVLDIAENSVRAGASLVEISLLESTASMRLVLCVKDNGKGMDAQMLARVTDPFTTTRTTRKVGLGLPFLKMAARQTGGDLAIESQPGVGTTVTATFTLGHIDLMPLGDMGATMATLVQGAPDIDFVYTYQKNGAEFAFDTRQARQILDGVSLNTPEVFLFIRDHVGEGMAELQAR